MVQRVSFALGFLALIACTHASADVIVSTHATAQMSCSAGVCTPTAAKAFLNVNDLESMLGSGDLTVKSDAAALNIHVAATISWANTNTLTLDAYHNLAIRAPIAVGSTGGLSLVTNDGGSGGDIIFGDKGRVTFSDAASNLTINGNSYTLVGSVSALAAAVTADRAGHIALMNDYDASADGAYTQAPVQGGFNGTLIGLGNAIDNLSIAATGGGSGGVCLGPLVTNSGTIRNIAMNDALVTLTNPSSFSNFGGILACQSGGQISDVAVVGTVSLPGSTSVAGGLVGENSGTIEQSSADAVVTGTRAGGLSGTNSGTVDLSSATGRIAPVPGGAVQGGLVGENSGTITLSHASTDLSHLKSGKFGAVVGGLVGENTEGSIMQCYASGPVAGGRRSVAGGLVGRNYHASITQSYALGQASAGLGRVAVGGLVGADRSSTIAQVYSTGAVSSKSGGGNLGGLLGTDLVHPGNNTSAYWDLDTSGVSNPAKGAGDPLNDPGITGLSDATLKSGLPSGFDPAVWGSGPSINGGLPYLLALPPR